MPGYHTNYGAKRAREARAALGLDPGGPLDCLLSVVEQRCPVVVTSFPDDVAGACSGEVLWVNGLQLARRQRFTLAHELGHAWMRHERLEPDSVETIAGRTSEPREVQANAFAAEFLVPKAGLAGQVDGEPTLEDVVRVAGEYGVSAPMMLIRFGQTGLGSAARLARLQREVDDGLHGLLGGEAVDDRLARIEALPYLSPALEGSLLAAALHGDAPVSRGLAGALERIMRPVRR